MQKLDYDFIYNHGKSYVSSSSVKITLYECLLCSTDSCDKEGEAVNNCLEKFV